MVNSEMQKGQRLSTQSIQRAVWIVLAALITSLALFGGYYYWDRYVRLGDQSPLELDVQHLEEAIREDPQNPEARVALSEYYVSSGQYQEGLKQANQVLRLYPEHEGALLISGIAYVRMDQPEAALEPLERFVALRKDQEMAHIDTALEAAYYFLGESYVKLDRPAEAIPLLEAALAINRTDADALYQVGVAYQANSQPEIALERYQQAVRFVPDFTEAYSGMIESYTALDQPDYVAYARGMQAFTLGDYETAQIHLKHATQALPDFAAAFLGLGLTYEKTGSPDAALGAIQRALELNPGDFATQQAHGRLQAASNVED
jgi:tetratricopeptide (TPR) repeat protein